MDDRNSTDFPPFFAKPLSLRRRQSVPSPHREIDPIAGQDEGTLSEMAKISNKSQAQRPFF